MARVAAAEKKAAEAAALAEEQVRTAMARAAAAEARAAEASVPGEPLQPPSLPQPITQQNTFANVLCQPPVLPSIMIPFNAGQNNSFPGFSISFQYQASPVDPRANNAFQIQPLQETPAIQPTQATLPPCQIQEAEIAPPASMSQPEVDSQSNVLDFDFSRAASPNGDRLFSDPPADDGGGLSFFDEISQPMPPSFNQQLQQSFASVPSGEVFQPSLQSQIGGSIQLFTGNSTAEVCLEPAPSTSQLAASRNSCGAKKPSKPKGGQSLSIMQLKKMLKKAPDELIGNIITGGPMPAGFVPAKKVTKHKVCDFFF